MTFEYRNQPYKSLYLVYSALFILLWWLPYWTLISIIPSWRPRPTWGILRTIYINALRKFIEVLWAVGHGIAESLPSSEGLVKIEALPRGLLVGELKELAERNEVGNEVTSGYWYQRKDRVGKIDESANPDEKIVYHIHGKHSSSLPTIWLVLSALILQVADLSYVQPNYLLTRLLTHSLYR